MSNIESMLATYTQNVTSWYHYTVVVPITKTTTGNTYSIGWVLEWYLKLGPIAVWDIQFSIKCYQYVDLVSEWYLKLGSIAVWDIQNSFHATDMWILPEH